MKSPLKVLSLWCPLSPPPMSTRLLPLVEEEEAGAVPTPELVSLLSAGAHAYLCLRYAGARENGTSEIDSEGAISGLGLPNQLSCSDAK